MASVLPDADQPSVNLKKGMLSVANDETGHAAYLYEAMQRRLPAADVQKLVDEWRTRKVNAMLAMVGNFVQGKPQPSLVQDGAPAEISEEETSQLAAA